MGAADPLVLLAQFPYCWLGWSQQTVYCSWGQDRTTPFAAARSDNYGDAAFCPLTGLNAGQTPVFTLWITCMEVYFGVFAL